jgi:DNA-binding beta-propeller fold protein YncE
MKSLNQFLSCGIVALQLLLFTSCTKTEGPISNQEPVIVSIFPSAGRGGDTITVTGKHFLRDISQLMLLINNKPAEVVSATEEEIKGLVPAKAGHGKVSMRINGTTYEGPEFSYTYKVIVTTVAGTGLEGNADGPGEAASFKCPWGLVTNEGGDVFVADCYNRLIRKIDAVTQKVSTYPIPTYVSGGEFYSPYNIAYDRTKQNFYVTDFNKHLMRMDINGNMELIFEDEMPLTGVAVSPAGDHLFVSNNSTGTISKLDMDGKNKTIFTTGLVTPRNIVFDHGGRMFVTAFPGPVYEIDSTGNAHPATKSSAFSGWEMVVDRNGIFFLADHFNNCIRLVDKTGNSLIIAGNGQASDVDGIGLAASFDGPQGITIDDLGQIYVSTYNYDRGTGNKIRKIVLE